MLLVGHPVLCNYYITYRCNASCSFCDIWEKPSPFVTLTAAQDNFKDLKRLGVRVIDFTGGEPLLHRQLPELLALAKKMGFITTVTTNAVLYAKYAQRLKKLIDMLHFSLDSPDKEEHDKIRGIKCFDSVLDSIQIAKSLGERPDVLFTAMNENIHLIERLLNEICIPNKLLLIVNPIFDYNEVETGTGLSRHSLDVLENWGKHPSVYLNKGFIELRRDGGNHIKSPVCRAASSTIVISPDNKLVLPCYHLGIEQFDIDGQLYSLYHSQRVQQLVAMEGRYPACEGCVINCYMQPSFAVKVNKYWWKAFPSTIKYNFVKGTWKQLSIF